MNSTLIYIFYLLCYNLSVGTISLLSLNVYIFRSPIMHNSDIGLVFFTKEGSIMANVSRKLQYNTEIESFLENILGIHDVPKKKAAIRSIDRAEAQLEKFGKYPTKTHDEYRDIEYRTSSARTTLRERVIRELIEKIRLDNDDEIELGSGGAKPKHVCQNKQCYFVIGLPASGKSGVAARIADYVGAYIMDSDLAKRKLPEYYEKDGGASLVHDEADDLIWNYKDHSGKNLNLLNYCVAHSYNMVVPTVGARFESLKNTMRSMSMDHGYKVFLILVELDRAKAVCRAYNRFEQTSRYVPLAKIFDEYSNNPTITYFKISQYASELLEGHAHLNNDVEYGENPRVLACINLDGIEFNRKEEQ
jgi:Zeta toxin.